MASQFYNSAFCFLELGNCWGSCLPFVQWRGRTNHGFSSHRLFGAHTGRSSASVTSLHTQPCNLQADWKSMNPWLIGWGHRRRWRGQGCFAQPQQGETGPLKVKKKKKLITIRKEGWKSKTLEEVKEAQLLSSHTLPEHAGSPMLTSST